MLQVSSYVTTPFLRIRNLTIGKEYDFQVMAENKYGISDPAENTQPIRAKHPFGMSPCFVAFFNYSLYIFYPV